MDEGFQGHEATALDIGLKVVKPIILLNLLPMFGEGSFFSSLFGCRSHVVETGEQAASLSYDDGH